MQNFARFHAIEPKIELSQEMWEKTKWQRPLLNYMYPNRIIAISNDIYFAYKFSCNFIHQKLRSAYPKSFGKSETTVPPVERFSPKVDRHQFTFR